MKIVIHYSALHGVYKIPVIPLAHKRPDKGLEEKERYDKSFTWYKRSTVAIAEILQRHKIMDYNRIEILPNGSLEVIV